MSEPLKTVQYVQFGTLTAAEWKKFGIKISRPSTRGGSVHKTPYDPRLGVLDNGKDCPNCLNKNKVCTGHFGYIELEEPVLNPRFLNVILKILRCVCAQCSSPRLLKDQAEIFGIFLVRRSSRLKTFEKKCQKILSCPSCEAPLPNYEEKNGKIKKYYGKEKGASPKITARQILSILLKITPETETLLGFNDGLSDNSVFKSEDVVVGEDKIHLHQLKPESFVFTRLPVLPICCRPWVMRDGEKRDDDLTDKYNSILKVNRKLKEDRKTTNNPDFQTSRKKTGRLKEKDRSKELENLVHHIWTLIDNRNEKSKLSSGGRAHKGISDRLGQKEGHFQTNVAGKRADFTARTVIVPGGDLLNLNEVGVPSDIARNLTIQEMVTEWNIDYLQSLLDSGKVNFLIRDGCQHRPEILRKKYEKKLLLQPRDIVERQLQNGDPFIFNRQPTLRLESMQGMVGVVMDIMAFRLSMGATRPYNADCDGDKPVSSCLQQVAAY